jgi:ABC-2 type transport system permease protein
VLNDFRTIIWKEWREYLAEAGASRSSAWLRLAVPMVVFGVFIPWRMGPQYVDSYMTLIIPSFVPLFGILAVVADSFAGERERHTLETLLATRLSDQAILSGKLAAAVLGSWVVSLAVLMLGLIGVNIIHWQGGLLLFPWDHVAVVLGFTFLVTLVLGSAGVLVSLRAPTVRQAVSTLVYGFMIIVYGGVFAIRFAIPEEWRLALLEKFAGRNLVQTEIAAAVILFALAVTLFILARIRFQRARLILD